MIPNIGGVHRCKRCGHEVDRGRNTCPKCNFNPQSKGLRVALCFLFALVLLMTGVMLSPVHRILMIQLAGLAFVCSVVALLISFVATPHRLGRLFLWL